MSSAPAAVAPADSQHAHSPPPARRTARQLALIERLIAYIITHGFTRLTTRELAGALGCARSTLYALAPSKEELVRVCIEHLFQTIRAGELDLHIRDRATIDILDDIVANMVANSPRVSRRYIDDVRNTPDISKMYYDFELESTQRLANVMRRGMMRGEIAMMDPMLAADFWLSNLLGIIRDPSLSGPEISERQRLAERMALVHRAIMA